jgi:hypothetical protein
MRLNVTGNTDPAWNASIKKKQSLVTDVFLLPDVDYAYYSLSSLFYEKREKLLLWF